jgi:hypothetical protein
MRLCVGRQENVKEYYTHMHVDTHTDTHTYKCIYVCLQFYDVGSYENVTSTDTETGLPVHKVTPPPPPLQPEIEILRRDSSNHRCLEPLTHTIFCLGVGV